MRLTTKTLFIATMSMGMPVSANMMLASNFLSDSIGIQRNTNKSMYLGSWLGQISNKINPKYFNQLSSRKFSKESKFTLSTLNFSHDKTHINIPVFRNSFTDSLLLSNSLNFSFTSENLSLSQNAFTVLASQMNSNDFRSNKVKGYSNLVAQNSYTPGYNISNENSSFGVSAVFVQQRYLDSSFDLTKLISSSNIYVTNENLYSSNKGLGYQLNFTERLPYNFNLGVTYKSKIKMNEFDLYGGSYSESSDNDIPSHFKISLDYSIFDSFNIKLSADHVTYGESDKVYLTGSEEFYGIINTPLALGSFKLKNTDVFELEFNQKINDSFVIYLDIISRQQAETSEPVITNVLDNHSAPVSYKVGLSKLLANGEISFIASFANKPVFIGKTDFGRFSSNGLNSHIEGLASWSYSF